MKKWIVLLAIALSLAVTKNLIATDTSSEKPQANAACVPCGGNGGNGG